MDWPDLPESPYLVKLSEEDVRTRNGLISLSLVIDLHREGTDPKEITRNYPPLDLETIHGVLGYYARHRELVDRYVANTHQRSEENYQAYLGQPPPPVISRLRALKAKKPL